MDESEGKWIPASNCRTPRLKSRDSGSVKDANLAFSLQHRGASLCDLLALSGSPSSFNRPRSNGDRFLKATNITKLGRLNDQAA
jgi:hypothetical protein